MLWCAEYIWPRPAPGVARISASVEVAAPRARVWQIISDLDAEPRFWKGTKSVRNVSGGGNRRVREVTIAFRDQKCMQEVYLEPPSRVRSVFTEGVLDGTKVLEVEERGQSSVLRAEWDVRLTGAMSVFGGLIAGHIRRGTEQALEAIREEAGA